MLNINQLLIDAFVAKLQGEFLEMYGDSDPHYTHAVQFSARQALEQIANTDTLYHNVEIEVKGYIRRIKRKLGTCPT